MKIHTVCRACLTTLVATLGLAWSVPAAAQVATWGSTGAGTYTWSNTSNWLGGAAPATSGTALFDSTITGPLSVFTGLTGTTQIAALQFSTTNSVTINSSTTQVLRISGGGTIISVNSGSHTMAGNGNAAGTQDYLLGTGTFSIASGAQLTISGRIVNQGAGPTYVKSGGGTLLLSGANGWVFGTGSFTVNEGVLALGNSNASGANANRYFVTSGAAMELRAATYSSGTLTLNGDGIGGAGALRSTTGASSVGSSAIPIVLGSNASIGVDSKAPLTISRDITGAFNLSKVGSGTLTLALGGTYSYSGTTSINAGTLQIGNSGTAGALNTLSVITGSSGGTLAFNRTDAITQGTHFANGISGGIGVLQQTGTLTLSSSNSYSGGTVVSGGSLLVGSNNALGSGTATISGGVLDVGAYTPTAAGLTITSGTLTGSGTFAGSSYALQGGAVNAILGTGAITVSSGTTTLGSAGRLNSASALTISSGQLSLGGNESVSGFTLTGGGVLGGAGTLTSSSTYDVQSGSVSAILGGSVGLTKSTSGTVALSGVNTYTGATSITGGQLRIDTSGRIRTTSGITVNGVGAEFKYNANLALNKPLTLTQGTLSGVGSIGVAVSIGSDAIISPGNSGASLVSSQSYQQGLTFAPGGRYTWEIKDWTGGLAGTNYDLLAVSGSALDITATSGATFTIAINGLTNGNVAGAVPNFSGTVGTSFTIATSSNAITGFDKSKFTVNSSALTNNNSLPSNAGFWLSTTVGGTSLILNYAPSATYNLSATASAAAIRLGDTSTITATVTSSTASVTSPDQLAFSGLTLSNVGSLSATSGTVAPGAFASGNAVFTGISAGAFTFTPAVGAARNDNIGTNANVGSSANATVTVYRTAAGSISSGTTVNLGLIHAGGSFGSQTLTITNTAASDGYSEGLNAAVSGAGGVASFSGTSITNLAAGGSLSTITVGLGNADTSAAGTKIGSVTIGYQSNGSTTSGLSTISAGSQTVSLTGNVYSGQSTWATAGGGNWGTLSSGFGTNWGTNQGSPGLDADFVNTDTATFGSALASGTAAINTNGANISLKSLTFNNSAGSYAIYQTGGSGSLTLLTTGTSAAGITVAAGSHTIHSDVALGSNTVVDIATGAALTFHNAISGAAAFGLTKTGAGTLTLTGANDFTGGITVASGTLQIGAGGSSGSIVGNVVNNAALVFNRSGTSTFAGNISGTGLLHKLGVGTVKLTGSHSHSGGTTVSEGTLSVNGYLSGTSALVVQSGAAIGGSGVIAGGITGDGQIGPGNSPGILTTPSITPTGNTSFAFEFTQLGAPTWSTGTASGNDLLHLTDPTAPIVGSLASSNIVNVYFSVTSLAINDTFLGGFFTDKSGDFSTFIKDANYRYYVLGNGFGTATTYNGAGYYDLASWAATDLSGFTNVGVSTVASGTANFAIGTITTGQVTQFVIVPEPDTIIFAGIGIAMAGWSLWKRRRMSKSTSR